MNAHTIMRAANPVNDMAFAEAWCDAEGQATLEGIVATGRDASPRPSTGRRRRALIGWAAAVGVGAAVAVIGIPGVGHEGAAPAWSVTKSADGTVAVTFNDYSDPAGLQARLRAAGVRANVDTLAGSCSPTTPLENGAQQAVISWEPSSSSADPQRVHQLFPPVNSGLEINPRYLPSRDTIWIGFPSPRAPAADAYLQIAVAPTATGPHYCFDS